MCQSAHVTPTEHLIPCDYLHLAPPTLSLSLPPAGLSCGPVISDYAEEAATEHQG